MPTKPPPLKDRIAEIRAEIDAYIDGLVEKDAGCGIPRQVLRNMLTGRAGDCQCRQYLIQTGELLMSTDCPKVLAQPRLCSKLLLLRNRKQFNREYAALKIKHEKDRIDLMKKLGLTEEDVARWKAESETDLVKLIGAS